ncbi:MAG: type II toxin-antitoxin system VapC family toxin [Cyanobacteria bacterium CAN_BIN43]|jgi:PIN domain nuclease of toxin-antitoxin system|nr:type II toxin-antitoxin system VapC family toxin [Cyanobacteria bacterium CAN_BIN43]
MKLLVDTNAFIWLNDAPDRIPQRIMAIIADPNNELLFSLVSVWEMQIKIQLGKLQLQDPLSEILLMQQSENNLQMLPIQLDHIWALEDLPQHHRDPFDRLLIAQAQVEDIAVVTSDDVFDQYSVQRFW